MLLLDPSRLFAGGRAADATALMHVHAASAAEAVGRATAAVSKAARVLFVTEGLHLDQAPNFCQPA